MKAFTLALCGAALIAATASADVPKPVKVTRAQAAGPIFERKDAVHENGADGPTSDVRCS